jgi:nitrate/nitrite transport system ATP-binding protein
VLKDINLDIEKGEFVSVIGHSGCGKSTLLNIIAGLTPVSAGAVLLENQGGRRPRARARRRLPEPQLLPWLTVYENVALAVNKVFGRRRARPSGMTGSCTISTSSRWRHAKPKRPAEISGGMKQRVGIARGLAMEPKILLLDEPFGALDALTRAHLQDSVMEIHAALGNTMIMITHDVDEAVLLSDRIVMMTNGPAATSARCSTSGSRGRASGSNWSPTAPTSPPRGGAEIPLRAPPLRRGGVREHAEAQGRTSPPAASSSIRRSGRRPSTPSTPMPASRTRPRPAPIPSRRTISAGAITACSMWPRRRTAICAACAFPTAS